jgi:hypothetical protein
MKQMKHVTSRCFAAIVITAWALLSGLPVAFAVENQVPIRSLRVELPGLPNTRRVVSLRHGELKVTRSGIPTP